MPNTQRLQRTAPRLLALNGFEERLKVPLTKTLRAAPLDHLEKERRAVLHRLGEDLEQVPLLVTVDQDAQLRQLVHVFLDRPDTPGQQLVVRLRDLEKGHVVGAERG